MRDRTVILPLVAGFLLTVLASCGTTGNGGGGQTPHDFPRTAAGAKFMDGRLVLTSVDTPLDDGKASFLRLMTAFRSFRPHTRRALREIRTTT